MSGFPAQNQAQKGLQHYTASKAQEKSIFGGEMDAGKPPVQCTSCDGPKVPYMQILTFI